MAIGSWSPDDKPAVDAIDPVLLQRFIHFSNEQQLDRLNYLLSHDEQQAHAALMTLPAQQWLTASESLSPDELIALIKFFTLAEQLPGWFAGERSPVIPLAKQLRKQQPLEKALIQWIRSHSDNRFLPYGPL